MFRASIALFGRLSGRAPMRGERDWPRIAPAKFLVDGVVSGAFLLAFRPSEELFLTVQTNTGEVAEWSNARAWKARVSEREPGVRIPPSPPVFNELQIGQLHSCQSRRVVGKRELPGKKLKASFWSSPSRRAIALPATRRGASLRSSAMVNGQAAVLFQVIAGAASAGVILGQNFPVHQVGDVAQRCIRGAFGDIRPF
jgi:hypothetical protein